MTGRSPGANNRRGFTLMELLVVVGLIALLMAMFLPVVGKARAAANATVCASNLRQMGTAWEMYIAESRGRLPDYIWNTPATPDVSWRGYWVGIVDTYRARGDVLRCPSASMPLEGPVPLTALGMGNASCAWTGRTAPNGTGVRFNATQYREGSYGYNRYLTVGGGFSNDRDADKITAVRQLSDLPLIMDCAYADAKPQNGTLANPAKSPPDLTGASVKMTSPEQWRFLLARHGRGINICMADGSVRRVPLEKTYELRWTSTWVGYPLRLPLR